LEEGGQTALGPAMLVAIMMASKVPGSKVVMCTDGLANIGLGNLDTESADEHSEASSFFAKLGETAKDHGFVWSICRPLPTRVFCAEITFTACVLIYIPSFIAYWLCMLISCRKQSD